MTLDPGLRRDDPRALRAISKTLDPGFRRDDPRALRAISKTMDPGLRRDDPRALRAGHLPMQKVLKIAPSRSSAVVVPVISPSACWAWRSSSASSSPAFVAASTASPSSR